MWDDKYSVDNEELDNHHQKLFDILNRLYISCFEENEADVLAATYQDLLAYIDYHFSAEELYMKQLDYDSVLNHVTMHNTFNNRISSLQQQIDHNNLAATKELIVYLGNWLLNHVLVEDRKYAVHAAQRA
jgi:hemerythrin-like metal-binding protein